MVKTKDNGVIKSNMIICEVQKRPCLYDTNHPEYGDRVLKTRSWDEVCLNIVPGWTGLSLAEKYASGKEIQKRWRSIRDSFTKAYRQGKHVLPESCSQNSRRYLYRHQMAFLLQALQNRKKPKAGQDKFETFPDISSSPLHPPADDVQPKITLEVTPAEPKLLTIEQKLVLADPKYPLAEAMFPPVEHRFTSEPRYVPSEARFAAAESRFASAASRLAPEGRIEQNDPKTVELKTPIEIKNPSLEIKIDSNSILPEDYFDDDKLFMNSLLPLFKKMDDDTRLLCRIEVLKIIRYALQGNKCFEALRIAEDSFFKTRISGILAKEEAIDSSCSTPKDSKGLMTTRSADSSRPGRKRKIRSPSPVQKSQPPPKKRGPGRPRKIRPPEDSEDEALSIRRMNASFREPRMSEMDEELSRATSVAQLKTPLFMKMYNLEPTKKIIPNPPHIQLSIKSEPADTTEQSA